MATLPTQGFSMSRLPEFARADPRDYAFDQEELGKAFTFVPRTLAELDRLNEVRNEFGTLKATRGSRRALATQTADAAAEDFPLVRSVRNAGLAADLPTQGVRKVTAERELGSLDRNSTVLTDVEDTTARNNLRAQQLKQRQQRIDDLSAPTDEEVIFDSQAKRAADARTTAQRNAPTSQRMETRPDGSTWEIETFRDEQGLEHEVATKQTATAEAARQSRDLRAAQIKATDALATQRTGVGRIRTFQSKVGDPQLGGGIVTTSVDGNGKLVSQSFTNAEGQTSSIPLPAEDAATGEAPVGQETMPTLTPEEAATKPEGFRFIGTDGIPRTVRRAAR